MEGRKKVIGILAAQHGVGHNTGKAPSGLELGLTSKEKLQGLAKRIKALEEERKGLMQDIKEVYTEAQEEGFDRKALKEAMRVHTREADDKEHREMVNHYLRRSAICRCLPCDDRFPLVGEMCVKGGDADALSDHENVVSGNYRAACAFRKCARCASGVSGFKKIKTFRGVRHECADFDFQKENTAFRWPIPGGGETRAAQRAFGAMRHAAAACQPGRAD